MAGTIDIRELNEKIERQSAFVTNLMAGMDQVIVGQKHLVESLLIGLLSDGHVLLEGHPYGCGRMSIFYYLHPKFMAFFVAIYSANDASFVLQPTKFCGKIFMRHNSICLALPKSVHFYLAKMHALFSILFGVSGIVSQQSEPLHFSGA